MSNTDLVGLLDGTQTAAELGLTEKELNGLIADEVLRAAGTRKTGRRGRPPKTFGLTDKGRKRAKRAAA